MNKLQDSKSFTKYWSNLVKIIRSIACKATFTCLSDVDCVDEESYTHRILSYGDISLIANKKYGYSYDNIDTIFDICGSSKHLEQHIRSYLERTEADQNRTLTSIVNIYNAHWVAMVISYRNNQYYAYYVDSLGMAINSIVHQSLNTCNIYNIYNIYNVVPMIKQQTDDYNCGLWALENAYHINNVIKDHEPYFDIDNFMLPERNAEYFVQTREMYLSNDCNNI